MNDLSMTGDVKARACRVPGFRVQLVRDGGVKTGSPLADSPAAAAALLRAYMGEPDREHFVALLLNARSNVIGVTTVSIGTLSASLVHPRELFKPAILAGAATVIIAHNHPSGDATPSHEDREMTRRMVKAGELLSVPVIDHVILGAPDWNGCGWYSFKDSGVMPRRCAI